MSWLSCVFPRVDTQCGPRIRSHFRNQPGTMQIYRNAQMIQCHTFAVRFSPPRTNNIRQLNRPLPVHFDNSRALAPSTVAARKLEETDHSRLLM